MYPLDNSKFNKNKTAKYKQNLLHWGMFIQDEQ